MTIGDRVVTPAGPGTVVGWYRKGARTRIIVAIGGRDTEAEEACAAEGVLPA